MIEWLTYCVVGAACISVLFYFNAKFSLRLHLIDWPKSRGKAPRLILFGPSFALLGGVLLVFFEQQFSPWMLLSTALLVILGIYEDQKKLSKVDRYFYQLLAVGLTVFLDPHLQKTILTPFGNAGACVTVLAFTCFLNAMKNLDGNDGLVPIIYGGGILTFLSLGRFLFLSEPLVLINLFLLGALIPFAFLNTIRRTGALGSAGAYFLAFFIGFSHLSLGVESTNVWTRLSLPTLTFLIPAADIISSLIYQMGTLFAPWRRKNFGHLSDKLSLSTASRLPVFLASTIIQLVGAGTTYVLYQMGGLQALGPLLAVGQLCLVISLILLMERHAKKSLQYYLESLHETDWIFIVRFTVVGIQAKPVSYFQLRRLENRVHAEIRITDLCYLENPNQIFIVLRTPKSALEKILGRLEKVFIEEHAQYILKIDEGKFSKMETLPLQKSA